MKGRWAVVGLRALAWVALAAGLGTAIALWVTAPETVTTTEEIGGHGTITFEGVKTTISAFQVWMGFVSLGAGAFAFSLSLAVASMAERLEASLPTSGSE